MGVNFVRCNMCMQYKTHVSTFTECRQALIQTCTYRQESSEESAVLLVSIRPIDCSICILNTQMFSLSKQSSNQPVFIAPAVPSCHGLKPALLLLYTRAHTPHRDSQRLCVEINVTSSPHPQQKKIQFSFTFIPETNVTVKEDTTTRDQATLFVCVVCVCLCVSVFCSKIVNSFKVMYCCLYLQSYCRPWWCCCCPSMTGV